MGPGVVGHRRELVPGVGVRQLVNEPRRVVLGRPPAQGGNVPVQVVGEGLVVGAAQPAGSGLAVAAPGEPAQPVVGKGVALQGSGGPGGGTPLHGVNVSPYVVAQRLRVAAAAGAGRVVLPGEPAPNAVGVAGALQAAARSWGYLCI